MGNKHGKAIGKKEMKAFQEKTHFEADEIRALYDQFMQFRTSEDGKERTEAVINKKEFQLALGCRDSLFVERIFELFDENTDGLITFAEFIAGIGILSTKSTLEQKLTFSFKLYDFNNDGKIDKPELKKLLTASIAENKVPMEAAQVDAMVDQTFESADLNKDGFIDFDEYHQMCVKHPAILKPLTMNVSEIIAEVKALAAREDGAATGAGAGAGAGTA